MVGAGLVSSVRGMMSGLVFSVGGAISPAGAGRSQAASSNVQIRANKMKRIDFMKVLLA